MQSILVATDLSSRAAPALWGAAQLARQVGDVDERLPVAEKRPGLVILILGPGGRMVGEGAGQGVGPGTLLEEVACSVLRMPDPRMPATELLQSSPSAAAAGGD